MGKPAILRENMNKKLTRAFCAIFSAALLAGCSSQGSSGVSVADFGTSGGVNYSGITDVTSGTESAQTTRGTESAEISSVPESRTDSVGSTASSVSASPETSVTTRTDAAPEPAEVRSDSTTTSAATSGTPAPSVTGASTAKPSAAQTTTEKTTARQTSASTSAPEVPGYDYSSTSYTALNYQEVKGVWISYIELAELMQGQSKSAFRSNIAAVFDNCVSLGINTVYVHVRSHSDAYYKSELFPWSKYITGTLGSDPGYDPLAVMLEEAHSRSLSFQAWINPLRACSTSQINSYGSYPVYTFATASGMAGKYAVDVNGTYYLNPAYEEVTELIAAGASEILSNYDVDGLHIDDYFYPTTDTSFDSSAYSGSGYSSLSDFRFANCDRMVRELYSAVKKTNPTAIFSVSVQGRIDNNYNQLYADVRKWCTNSGYLDVMIPQIYYGFENTAAPYQSTLDEWEALAKKGGIPLIVGLSVSKVGCEDAWAGGGKNEWITNHDIISRQLAAAKKCSTYGGFALYSYRSVFSPDSSVSAAVSKEISALKELI